MPQTLLLADDSVTIQRVIELTFADEAINVVAVSNGDQAIERIDSDPPDIVLVDIGMPGRTGYEVALHIKQTPRLKHIPVLLLTGAFEPVDQAKATAAGCDGVLAKPFEPQLVIARVKELLARGAEGASPAAPVRESLKPSTPPAPSISPAPPGDSWGSPRAKPKANVPQAEQVAHLDDYFDQLDAAFQKLGDSAPVEQRKAPAAPSPVAAIIDWFGGKSAASGPKPDLPLTTTAPAPERAHTPDPPEPVAPRIVPERAAETSPRAAEMSPRIVPEPAPETAPRFVPERAPEAAPRFVAEAAPETATRFGSERAAETAPRIVPEPAPETAPRFASEPKREKPTIAPRPERHWPSATLPPLADAFAAILAAERHEPMPALGTAWPTTPPGPSNGGAAPSEDAIEEITRRVLDRLSDRVVRETVADTISGIAERLVRDEIERIKATIK